MPTKKLSLDEVKKIRKIIAEQRKLREKLVSYNDIAKQFSVSREAINKIAAGVTWANDGKPMTRTRRRIKSRPDLVKKMDLNEGLE